MKKLAGIWMSFCLAGMLTVQAQTVYTPGVIYLKQAVQSPGSNQVESEKISPEYFNPLREILLPYGLKAMVRVGNGLKRMDGVYRVEISQTNRTEELINLLRQSGLVTYAEMAAVPTASGELSGVKPPSELGSGQMWYINKIQMRNWDLVNIGEKVRIAVIDNGVRLSHEDILDNLWVNAGEIPGNGIDDDGNGYIDDVNGFDVADGDGNPNPPSWASPSEFYHGTAVAGLTSASNQNSTGTVSVGVNTEIIAIKVVSDNTTNDMSMVYAYEGIAYAIAAGADIINCSWMSYGTTQFQRDMIAEALDAGILIIAAAGNDYLSIPAYPASLDGVVAVGATDNNDVIWKVSESNGSNYGNWIDVMAPGANIYTTMSSADNAYGSVSGTSFATPIVAGFAGLLLSQDPSNPQKVMEYIIKGCDNIDRYNTPVAGLLGAGRINVDHSISIFQGLSSNGREEVIPGLKIYPNPSSGKINFGEEAQVDVVELFSLQGQLVGTFIPENNQLDLRSLNLQGTYLLRVAAQGRNNHVRLVFHP